jgi:hypothetical protein
MYGTPSGETALAGGYLEEAAAKQPLSKVAVSKQPASQKAVSRKAVSKEAGAKWQPRGREKRTDRLQMWCLGVDRY